MDGRGVVVMMMVAEGGGEIRINGQVDK